jgi:hypothetical protein
LSSLTSHLHPFPSQGLPLAYVGDVVGTGSSRKSATNSILWYMGDDIPFVPNKRTGGVCIGTKIAPIFFNTMEDSGSLPIEMPSEELAMGDMIDIFPYEGVTKRHGTSDVICKFELKTQVRAPSLSAPSPPARRGDALRGVCVDAPNNHRIVPCGHQCGCGRCAEQLANTRTRLMCLSRRFASSLPQIPIIMTGVLSGSLATTGAAG